MWISTRGDYGLRAMIELARRYGTGEPVQAREIARRQYVPEDYLRQLLVALHRAGLVESARGAAGGYFLARDPSTITMAEVLRVLEGSLLPLECVTETGSLCQLAPACLMRPLWREAYEAILERLSQTTLDVLARLPEEVPTYQI